MTIMSFAQAASFVIRDIRVEGLQRISVGTVFNNIPYEVGQRVNENAGGEIIRSLYATGLFKDVTLKQDGGVLVVSVVERPSIASINISGNKDIDTDQLKQGLRDAGFTEGRVYSQFVLDRLKQDLKRSYFDRGKYGAIIKSTVSPLERNRVAIDINIREGKTARIRRINIVGNADFDEDDIQDEMKLSKRGFLTRFTRSDQYSAQKLEADIESVRSFYLDRGYIKFDVESTQVNITPEKEDVYLTVNIKEGEVYTIRDIKLAGKIGANPEEFYPLIHLRRGEPFSRKDVLESAERLNQALSDKGYAFATINPVPDVNEDNKTVSVTFYVEPGKRVYVRQINIKGNTRSRDRVLRREFRQMEAAWYSAEKVRVSKERIQRLGYFNNVEVTTKPVPGSSDQVDIEVNVEEKRSRELLLGVGYSQSGGVSLQAKVSDENFFGTGKKVTIGFNTSDVNTYFEVSYINPYYTVDGISQGFTIAYQKTDLEQLSTSTSNYAFDRGQIGVNFGFPITEHDRINISLVGEYIKLNLGKGIPSQISNFYSDGDNFLNYKLSVGWNHDTRDLAYFPTSGSQISLELIVAMPGSDLTFATLAYKHKSYFAITEKIVFAARGEIAIGDTYGNTNLYPFYEHFFAGGPGSIRGYEAYGLSSFRNSPAQSTLDSNKEAFGGQLLVTGSLELWFPPPFMENTESVRMVAFVDGGNVFRNYSDFSTSELRYSAGVGLSWLSPFGLLNFSYAVPIKDQPGDPTEEFQFTFGTNF